MSAHAPHFVPDPAQIGVVTTLHQEPEPFRLDWRAWARLLIHNVIVHPLMGITGAAADVAEWLHDRTDPS